LKSKIREWPILKLYQRRYNIKPAVFQRNDVWSPRQRRLLIDSVLRGIDIPKIYLEKSPNKPEWDIIDGHQRIDTINAFLNNEFGFDANEFLDKKIKLDFKFFKGMSPEKKEAIETYLFTIVEVSAIDEEELRLLFERLNLGTPLNSGERLNAIKSGLGDFIKMKMKPTQFISKIGIPERRFAKEQVCAQICNNSIYFNNTGEFRNSKYEDLENLYRLNTDFSSESPEAKGILENLNKLYDIFHGKVSLVRSRASAVTIYLFTEELSTKGELDEKTLGSFYVDFLTELRKQVALGIDATNRFLLQFQSRVIQGADAKTAIIERQKSLRAAYAHYLKHHDIITERRKQ
jgi:hypothetical protein